MHACVMMTRSCEVRRFALREDVVPGEAQPVAGGPPDTVGPDGPAVGTHDRLHFANPRIASGRWTCTGLLLYLVEATAGRMTTGCTVIPGLCSLVIAESESGSILFCEVPAP